MGLKSQILAAARGGGLLAGSRFLTRNRLRILAYHGVEEETDQRINADGFQVSPDVFRSHLAILRRTCHVCRLSDAVTSLTGKRVLPSSPVVITFDDGYRNNLTVAAPLLKEFGFPATFFITSGFVDGTSRPWWYVLRSVMAGVPSVPQALAARCGEEILKQLPEAERTARLNELMAELKMLPPEIVFPFLSWKEVRMLMDHGFEIGAHGATHVSLGLETPERAVTDARASLRRITEKTGKAPIHFAYPYGRPQDRCDAVEAALREEGVVSAATTCPGMNRPGDDIFRLNRMNVTGRHTPAAFEALISGFTHAVKPGQT